MSAPLTALYGALGGLLILVLGLNVSFRRRAHGIGLGEGAHGELTRAVRAHANTIEYLPIALVLLLLLELNGAPARLLHGLGATLILARVAHAQGLLMHGPRISPGRFLGTLGTWAVITIAAVVLIWRAAMPA